MTATREQVWRLKTKLTGYGMEHSLTIERDLKSVTVPLLELRLLYKGGVCNGTIERLDFASKADFFACHDGTLIARVGEVKIEVFGKVIDFYEYPEATIRVAIEPLVVQLDSSIVTTYPPVQVIKLAVKES